MQNDKFITRSIRITNGDGLNVYERKFYGIKVRSLDFVFYK